MSGEDKDTTDTTELVRTIWEARGPLVENLTTMLGRSPTSTELDSADVAWKRGFVKGIEFVETVATTGRRVKEVLQSLRNGPG